MEMFKYTFMQNAALAGLMVGLLCSVLSVFVVLKEMSFIGNGISHAAFGGIAFALLFNLDIFWTTVIFCILVAFLIGITSREGKISADSSIGLFLTMSMALGVVFLNLRKEYTAEVFGYLFGNILAVSSQDVLRVSVLGGIILLIIFIYFRQLQFFTFDEEVAKVQNVPTDFLYFLLLTILALTIVISVQVVGVILVSALLVIPGSIALLTGKRFLPTILISAGVGVFASLSGLMASYYARVSSGASIVIILFILFVAVFTLKKWRERTRKTEEE